MLDETLDALLDVFLPALPKRSRRWNSRPRYRLQSIHARLTSKAKRSV